MLSLYLVMCDCELTNDQAVIRRNPKVTSVNTAVEVDITGQVVADSLGDFFYSGRDWDGSLVTKTHSSRDSTRGGPGE